MKDFKQLKVWEKAHQLALAIYKATAQFPKEELYGLTSQIAGQVCPFQQTLPKAVDETQMPSLPASCKSQWISQ